LPQGCTSTFTDRNGTLYGVRAYRRKYRNEKGDVEIVHNHTLVRISPERPYRGKSERRDVIKARRMNRAANSATALAA